MTIMMMCSICKENYAVVFITKIIDGKQTQEGLCLSCAKKQGIAPINQLIEQTGMTDDDIVNLNKQVGDFFENMDIDEIGNDLSGAQGTGLADGGNPFLILLTGLFLRMELQAIHQRDPKIIMTIRTEETEPKLKLKKRRVKRENILIRTAPTLQIWQWPIRLTE